MKESYRSILNEILQERSHANPAYSLRSYARDLKVSPSTLSEVLNGKKGLSTKLALCIATSLRLPDWEIQYFCDLVTKEHAKSLRFREEASKRLQVRKKENSVRLLQHQAMKALTSWVDLAILELTYLKDFRGSVSWIARKLKVNELTVQNSIERLQQAQLLEVDKETGRWIDVSPLFSSTDGIPSESIRNFHKTVLNLALKKLDNPDVNSRIVKTVVFSISEENKPKAKKILNDAISQIVSLSDIAKQDRTEVMCFSTQLFSLLNKGTKL